MPRLVAPDTRFRHSFVEAMGEFAAEGEFFGDTLRRELALYGDDWHTPSGFARYVAAIGNESREEGVRPEGFVPATWYWYVDGPTFLGRIQIRHRLTPLLRDYGGHVGYGVRPTARRLGHARAMLREVLSYAQALGLDEVLLTCEVTNTGSRKVIEGCGGVLEDVRGSKARYWVSAGRIQAEV
ncbi:Acetyltransferase (GNAT) family protein [Streptomyces sp. YIM 130001]|uniref:GNAT family N-acetyltransferase n=1 Tax=Streptomyces sp. YIM 130001 TaxID=2259644 RepID=UPI000E65EA42|nr:GNAT family N-acetyltransferase [Streptomyces sp. YIM 130001]RII08693.1 Acetyltransferase (GNAT) family protein [Streptomyces sp. YIM 130001]